jgi:lipoic acid synthetase
MPVIPMSPHRQRLPPWLKRSLPAGGTAAVTDGILRKNGLVTVCEEATCPNKQECWAKKATSFMLMGHQCTRTCTFCDVDYAPKPAALDPTEPDRLAHAVGELGLRMAVITSVNRDDLPDGGAAHFAATVRALRAQAPATLIELLIPDFCGNDAALATVVDSGPDVLNHNLETIARLYPQVRPQAKYRRSLELLARAKAARPRMWTKSGIMVGLGESDDEVRLVLEDLRAHRVDIITIGQYLRPSLDHHDIIRFVTPEQFDTYTAWGKELGFAHIAAGPYVRSSYFAEEVLSGAIDAASLRAG